MWNDWYGLDFSCRIRQGFQRWRILAPSDGLPSFLQAVDGAAWTARLKRLICWLGLNMGFRPPNWIVPSPRDCPATLDRLLTTQPESVEFQQADSVLRKTALATGEIQDLEDLVAVSDVVVAESAARKDVSVLA